MALSKKSITGLGAFMSCAVIAVSGLLIVKPSYDQAQLNREEFSTLSTETESKTARLATLEEGVENYDEIREYVDTFLTYAPAEKDIESASRAISTAIVPGVTIQSFTFGTEEAAEKYPIPTASLENDSTNSSSSSSSSSSSGDEGEETATVAPGTFQRMPVEITVNADSYSSLSNYLDNLAQQDRLLVIMSVSSNRGEGVSATIKGYAFIYAR